MFLQCAKISVGGLSSCEWCLYYVLGFEIGQYEDYAYILFDGVDSI